MLGFWIKDVGLQAYLNHWISWFYEKVPFMVNDHFGLMYFQNQELGVFI